MKTIRLAIKDLEQNTGQIPGLPANPRQWTKTEVEKIAKSLRETPELFEARPIIVTQHGSKYVIPIGPWSGGTNVDTGATNRKLGSDMGDGVTGGGLHGKDLSKADVSVNIYAHLKAQESNREIKLCCAIGDKSIDGIPFDEIVNIARGYIRDIGGFEKFAEWGLV